MLKPEVRTTKILEFCGDPAKKEILLDSLCHGIENTSDFREAIEHVLTKIDLFYIPEFSSIYEDEDDILDLVLPSFRRVWSGIYVNPPTLFKNDPRRLEMFVLYFDIDEFLQYLRDMFIKTRGCLHNFEYLDRTIEHLQLVVDNYVAMLVKSVLECRDYKSEIRELRLKKITK